MEQERGDQRAVAVQHHDPVAPGESGFAPADSVGGAEEFRLLDEGDVVSRELIADHPGPVADDDREAFGSQLARRRNDMAGHRLAAHGVEDLGESGFHAGAHPRGKHNDAKTAHGTAPRRDSQRRR